MVLYSIKLGLENCLISDILQTYTTIHCINANDSLGIEIYNCFYLVIKRIGVTKNRDDANVKRWKRKMVSIMDPDATVNAPSVRRTILVTSRRRDRPELPLSPAFTRWPTIFFPLALGERCSSHKHYFWSIMLQYQVFRNADKV